MSIRRTGNIMKGTCDPNKEHVSVQFPSDVDLDKIEEDPENCADFEINFLESYGSIGGFWNF